MRVLSLDPSINNVGWCIFDSKAKMKKEAWSWGVWKLEGMNYMMRMMDLKERIVDNVGKFDILVTEWPAFYSSERGNIAAHQNYTIDLAGICMFIAGWFRMDHRKHFSMTASTWKGMVGKHITARKFFREFGKREWHISEHAIDATMMLKYWLVTYGPGVYKRLEIKYPERLL